MSGEFARDYDYSRPVRGYDSPAYDRPYVGRGDRPVAVV
jgi:hypothetical protein